MGWSSAAYRGHKDVAQSVSSQTEQEPPVWWNHHWTDSCCILLNSRYILLYFDYEKIIAFLLICDLELQADNLSIPIKQPPSSALHVYGEH